MYRLLLSLVFLTSCGVVGGFGNNQSQCDNEFVRKSVEEKTRDMVIAKYNPSKVDILLGKSSTVEVTNGQSKCQMDMTIKATKINYKAKSVAEIGE